MHNIKYLIVNADDFGMCKTINEASIDAFANGCVTSLSVMPCAPYFENAIFLAKKAKLKHMGIHLTLTSEFNSLRWGPVSPDKNLSLIDKDGFFHKTIKMFARYAKTSEIADELDSQIKKVIKYGVIPTHLDCHMFSLHSDVCLRKDFMPVLLYVCRKYKLPFRSPFIQEYRYLKKNRVPVLHNSFKESYDIPAQSKTKKYNYFIQNLEPGVSEIILHCGYDNRELRGITKHSRRRQKDYEFAVSRSTREFISELNVRLISWKTGVNIHRKNQRVKF